MGIVHFTVIANDLKRVLSIISKHFDKGLNIDFIVKNDEVEIIVFNGESQIKISFNASIAQTGDFSVNFGMLFGAIREFKDEQLDFLVEKGSTGVLNLKISSNKTKIDLICGAYVQQNHKNVSSSLYSKNLEFPINYLTNIFSKVGVCTSNNTSRPVLSGIFVHTEEEASEKKLIGVATDGKKLGCLKFKVEQGVDIGGMVIPRKIFEQINEISSLFKSDETITVYHDKFSIFFTINRIEFWANLIDGEFPKYKSVIPSNSAIYLDVKTQDFVYSLKKVASIEAKSDALIVSVNISENKISLNSQSSSNKVVDEIEVSTFGLEKDLTISLHLRPLFEILSAISTDYCRIKLNDNRTPIVILPIGVDYEVSYVIALIS